MTNSGFYHRAKGQLRRAAEKIDNTQDPYEAFANIMRGVNFTRPKTSPAEARRKAINNDGEEMTRIGASIVLTDATPEEAKEFFILVNDMRTRDAGKEKTLWFDHSETAIEASTGLIPTGQDTYKIDFILRTIVSARTAVEFLEYKEFDSPDFEEAFSDASKAIDWFMMYRFTEMIKESTRFNDGFAWKVGFEDLTKIESEHFTTPERSMTGSAITDFRSS